MALDATFGGSTANSYITIEEADAYFEDRLHSENWTDYTDKGQALVTATKMLERYVSWNAQPQTSIQALMWPDLFSNSIPVPVKEAVCELAFSLMSEDRFLESDLIGISSFTVGPISIEADKNDPKNPIPERIWAILGPLANRPNSACFERMRG